MSLDPIRPYLSLIKWGLAIAILLTAFIGGCRHGENNKAEKITELHGQIGQLQDANSEWADANARAAEQVQKNKDLAAAEEKKALAVSREMAAVRKQTAKRIGSLQKQLDDAMKEPECVDLLKAHFCPLVPLVSPP